jgi:hypothetical protein
MDQDRPWEEPPSRNYHQEHVEELEKLRAERDALRAEVERLSHRLSDKDVGESCQIIRADAAEAEIERLTWERDEAVSKIQWFADYAKAEIERLTRERDEAVSKIQWYADYANNKDKLWSEEMARCNAAEAEIERLTRERDIERDIALKHLESRKAAEVEIERLTRERAVSKIQMKWYADYANNKDKLQP